MDDLERAWPPDPIGTARLTLRPSEARDRSAYIQLYSSAPVATYTGGPHDAAELETLLPAVPGNRHGIFIVEIEGRMAGTIVFNQREAGRLGHLRPEGDELEIGYLFFPEYWGKGYATEAVGAALRWVTEVAPDEPVIVTTQTANVASMQLLECLGFEEIDRFEEFGAEQWFGRLRRVE